MGQIVSDFPSLPAEAASLPTGDPDPKVAAAQLAARAARLTEYANVYADLVRLGFAVPAQASNVVTRAQLLAHLQGLAGAIIKAEIATDPDSVYTGAPTDAQLAQLVAAPYTPGGVRRFPGSSLTGYQVAAGSTAAGLVLVTNPGLGAPGLLALAAAGLLGAGLIRFRAGAAVATVANRGAFTAVQLVPADNALTLATPLPGVPTVGDVCDLGLVVQLQQRPRINQVLAGLPFAPNVLTTADITAAKV
jgi:hypothetical protein